MVSRYVSEVTPPKRIKNKPMTNGFSHILNRGFEKRRIFFSEKDYLRFTHNLLDFNNREVAFLSYKNRRIYSEVTLPKEKNKIVDVLIWCEMPNHFHIMTHNRIEKGASLFAQKVTGGYTMQFNLHHQRSGTLFQGRTKVITVNHEAHWLHLPFYILANPLDIYQPGWKERGLRDPKKAFTFLKNYRWSALSDLLGKENFPKVINRELFFQLFNLDEKRLKKQLLEWLAGYNENLYGTQFSFSKNLCK